MIRDQQTLEIKRLNPDEAEDFIKLIEIFKEVFENDATLPSKTYLTKLLSNPDFIVFVVKINHKVVGGLTIYVLHQYYIEKPSAYIYDVGISPEFQGKGIGIALISEGCKFCKENGFEDAYLEAELDDNEAINFYRKTQISSEMKAIHFTYSFANKNQ